MAVYFYQSPSGDGWRNLAVDRYFLEHLGAGDIMLYFYINENAVISTVLCTSTKSLQPLFHIQMKERFFRTHSISRP